MDRTIVKWIQLLAHYQILLLSIRYPEENIQMLNGLWKAFLNFDQHSPKYHMIWDVRKAFNYFRNLPVRSNFTLKEVSLKLAMLLCLVLGGHRMQTIHLINLKDIKYVGEQVFIPIMQKIKKVNQGIIFIL